MAYRSHPRPAKRGEPALFMLEAMTAAAFAAAALSVYVVILNRQTQLANQAKDLDLIETVVNEDINAIRHAARSFGLSSTTKVSGAYIYDPGGTCNITRKGNFDNAFRSDISKYMIRFPGANNINFDNPNQLTVKGYQITRTVSLPNDSNLTTSTQVNVRTANNAESTLRVRYTLTKDDKTTVPFAFERTADILIDAAFSC